jgi:hypothetical protein
MWRDDPTARDETLTRESTNERAVGARGVQSGEGFLSARADVCGDD